MKPSGENRAGEGSPPPYDAAYDGDLRRGAYEDDPETIRAAVAAGADPNSICLRGGLTVLHVAAMEGKSEAVRTLLALGAKPEFTDVRDDRAVHHAAIRNRLAAMRALAECGADVSAANGEGYTPLHLAVVYTLPSMVRMLLAFGADPNAMDGEGRTPLQFAEQVAIRHYSGRMGEVVRILRENRGRPSHAGRTRRDTTATREM